MALAAAYLAAIIFGALVGAVEIFQRYRAEPFDALLNRWGAAYVAFNSAVAAAAFWVATEAEGLTAASAALDLLRWAAIAGFGSAVLLRAKLLDIKLAEDKRIALGPEIVIQTFLAVIDRQLDRHRALRRFDTVRRLFTGVDFERAKLVLPLQVFQAMQTVTEDESQKLTEGIQEVDQMSTLGSQEKSYLLDLVGEDFLSEVLEKYGREFSGAGSPGPSPAPAAPPGSPAS